MSVHNHYEANPSVSDVFRKASRHSRRISILKFFLPLFALVIALIFSWFTFFFVPVVSDPVTFSHEEEEGVKLTMLNPKLEGYTRAHEPYWLKAEKAFQDRKRSGIIELENITAELFLGKQRRIFLDAQGGNYDNINGFLQLDKPFTITTNDGVTAQFMAANINLSDGQLNTDKRINIRRAGFHLTANSLQIREKGQKIYFHGGVYLLLGKK
ncbi:lipopolysaccharide export system protein LptC [Bartonella silvatica]|uniref:Lipopolysaccharide export system protein LptC n=1 Tax=Bartonella silvatica TaxID=357760 RepID=A0ABV2HES7_9HYPH